MIIDKKFTADIGLMLICKISGNKKGVVKGKIMEVLVGATFGNFEEISTWILSNRIKNTDNTVNNTFIDKINTARGL